MSRARKKIRVIQLRMDEEMYELLVEESRMARLPPSTYDRAEIEKVILESRRKRGKER